MSQTLFAGPCRFCLATNYPLSSAGIGVCGRCDIAISVTGTQPPAVTFARYRDVILEVVSVIDLAPCKPGEKWPHYKAGAILVHGLRREGRPIPESLMRPLSDGALKAFESGKSASEVVFTASQISMGPKVPDVKKEPRKSRVEKTNAPLKLW